MSQLLEEEQRLEKEQDEETEREELDVYERTGTAYFGIEAKHRRWQKKLKLTGWLKKGLKGFKIPSSDVMCKFELKMTHIG